MLNLSGLIAFPITPSDSAGRVDHPGLQRLLERLVAAKVDSIGLLGSTGTYAYLTRSERRHALETALDVVNGRMPVLVGIGALRTDDAVRIAQDAKAAGASAGLLAPMSYTPLNEDEVFEHFAVVARESGLPVCIYDNPATTHFHVTPTLASRLSRVPGVVAMKCPASDANRINDDLRTLRSTVPPAFSIGHSVDWHAAEALIAGGAAWFSVAAGLFPEPCRTIVQAVRSNEVGEARRLNARLQPLWQLFQAHSSLRVIYTAADILGLCRAEPPRPILPLSASTRQAIKNTLTLLDLA